MYLFMCTPTHKGVFDRSKEKQGSDSPSIVSSVDARFPFAVLCLLSAVKDATIMIKVEKPQILLVLFTPQPLLGLLIHKSFKPINYIFLHPLEIKCTRQRV